MVSVARLCAGALPCPFPYRIIRKFISVMLVVAGVHFLQIFLGVEQFVGQEVGVVAAAVACGQKYSQPAFSVTRLFSVRDAVISAIATIFFAVILLHDGMRVLLIALSLTASVQRCR